MERPIESDTRRPRLVAASWLVALVAFAPAARAQEVPAEAATRAQELFDEARALMRDGRYSEACPKLEESQRLDPGGGTLLNLGICHEKEGRTATAFRELTDALAAAGRDHRTDREKTASKHLDALAPQLSKLTVEVAADPACTDAVVKVDDRVLDPDDLGKALPFDPGTRRVSAAAPACQPWSKDVVLGPAADEQTVAVTLQLSAPPAPVAAAAPAANPPVAQPRASSAPADASQASSRSSSSLRTTGYAIGAAGVAAIGVGAYFGVSALVLKNRSDGVCHADGSCSSKSGVSDFDDAKTHAHIADIAIGAGLLAVGVGAYFVIRAGREERIPHTVAVSVGAAPAGAVATCAGSF